MPSNLMPSNLEMGCMFSCWRPRRLEVIRRVSPPACTTPLMS